MNSLSSLKVGDPLVVTRQARGMAGPRKVAKVGRIWLTDDSGDRYKIADGSGDGFPSGHAYTEAQWAVIKETAQLHSKLLSWGWTRARRGEHLTLDQLRTAARLLDAFEHTAEVEGQPALGESAFGRTGCHLIEGESPVASRRRGSLVEALQDTAEALRTGHKEVSFMLDLTRRNLADWRAER